MIPAIDCDHSNSSALDHIELVEWILFWLDALTKVDCERLRIAMDSKMISHPSVEFLVTLIQYITTTFQFLNHDICRLVPLCLTQQSLYIIYTT